MKRGFAIASFIILYGSASAAAPPRGTAICIGLNSVSPAHYNNWSGTLRACEADAKDMAEIAKSEGFDEVHLLLTANASREAVTSAIAAAAANLTKGDILVVSYSGHGGQVPDKNNDEEDHADETWCLYDGQIVDDELTHLWSSFAEGVRVFVISDSCHSGTVTRAEYLELVDSVPPIPPAGTRDIPRAEGNGAKTNAFEWRQLPNDVAKATYNSNQDFYDRLGKGAPREQDTARALKSTVILISGCQDNQLAMDGNDNGLFTETLKTIWANGSFKGNYNEFRSAILAMMPPYQSPNYYVIGADNAEFEGQRPWTK